MADKWDRLRVSQILKDLSALKAARIAEAREHVYQIDPGMRLARQIDACERFHFNQPCIPGDNHPSIPN